MGKKVKVTTKCGETFFYNHNQEVDTVEIVENKKGQDLVDADDFFIFATYGLGVEQGYYIEKKGAHFSLFNSDGDEIGFVGLKYSKDARVDR